MMTSSATSRFTREQLLARGRESFQKQAWAMAFAGFSAADEEAQLEPQDLVQLAQTALLIGKELEGAELLARAHQAFLSCGATQFAARCAFWLGFTLLIRGEAAKASGWLSRAGRLLDTEPECAEKGLLLLADGYRLFHTGAPAAAYDLFAQAFAIGERFGDRDLATMALQGRGRALIRQGEITRGVTLLDEAMIAVTAGEVSPLNAGGVYCSVLDACGEIFDLQRAQEWTIALEQWCASQPDLVPYRGHCLVRRAELLQLHGLWAEALLSAQQASEWLSRHTPKLGAGAAFYQVAEILRLRGNFAESEEAYGEASRLGMCLGPGIAQLRLAQGRIDLACTVIRRLAGEVHETGPRAKVLAAHAEIALAADDVAAASAAADELEKIATHWDIPFLHALCAYTRGAVYLAAGNAQDAFTELRRSWGLWRELLAPYDAARAQVLIAQACQQMGDQENAVLEVRAACDTFRRLGAKSDLLCAETLLSKSANKSAGPLTAREVQVVRLVASGMTNRAIAGKLRISEKTVARHLSNIFTKLDLPSRTAAAVYAYERDLV